MRGDCDEDRGEHDADGGEHPRGRPVAPHRFHGSIEPAVEQDERERQRAHPEGEAVVVELDPAEPLGAGEHPHQHEEERDRDADPLRGAAEQHAHRQQNAAGGEEQRDTGGLGWVGRHL